MHILAWCMKCLQMHGVSTNFSLKTSQQESVPLSMLILEAAFAGHEQLCKAKGAVPERAAERGCAGANTLITGPSGSSES